MNMSDAGAAAFALIMTFGIMIFTFVYIVVVYAMVFGIIILSLAGMALWVFMLVDCLQRNEEDFPEKNNWTVILILTFAVGMSWLGALIYYVKVKKPSRKLLGGASADTPPLPRSPKGKA
jgi:amino acid transporter